MDGNLVLFGYVLSGRVDNSLLYTRWRPPLYFR